MKKALLTLAIVGLVSGTALSKTDPSEKKPSGKLSLSTVEESKFSLNMSTEDKGVVTLKITDENGKLLISENVNYNKSFSLPIDMTSMKEGSYEVTAETPSTSLKQNIFVSKLYKDDVAAFLTCTEKGKYSLKVFHENVPVSIKIVDQKGAVYYENKINSDSNFIQEFDLTSIKNYESLEMIISGKKSTIYKSF